MSFHLLFSEKYDRFTKLAKKKSLDSHVISNIVGTPRALTQLRYKPLYFVDETVLLEEQLK